MNSQTLGILLIISALVCATCLALALVKVNRMSERMGAMEGRLGIEIQPFWGYFLSVLAEFITHPHERYAEMDALVAKALLEPATRMSNKDFARLEVLGVERSKDKSPDMRPGEQDAVLMFIGAVKMVRLEAKNKTELSSITIVGRQKPEGQSFEDEIKSAL